MANKNYYDLIYAWFQYNSEVNDDGMRYVLKSNASFARVGEECQLERHSVSKYVKYLLDRGLLTENKEEKVYFLGKLDASAATLVPYPVLRQLLNALSRNAVSLYVYLLDRYIAEGEKSFQNTYSHLKSQIGISTKTQSNDIVIKDILDVLRRLSLVEYHVEQTEYDKRILIIDKVTNVLPKE